jgi:toxoflavin synthase
MTTHYDAISDAYAALAKKDPVKMYVQYPLAMRLLEGLQGPILDIGCGNGHFTRAVAATGKSVIGYDNSEEQLRKAQHEEQEHPLGIRYVLSEPETFLSPEPCNAAISVMVLMYARNREHLTHFFRSAFRNTTEAASFVAVIFNPSFRRLGQRVYQRRWTPDTKGNLTVEFFENGNEAPVFTASYPNHSVSDYETAVREAGYRHLDWKNAEITEEGMERVGAKFWNGFLEDCPYIGLVATK